ncbi:DUF1906 domain-containing protein [Streptomyces sp. NPDC054838]
MMLASLLGAALLAPAPPAVADGRTVEYHGLRLTVPAHWRVVDLDRHPDACLRLDLPTLYLGHAGGQGECSGRAVRSRADTLHLEPLGDAPERADVPTVRADGSGLPPAPSGDSREVRYALRGSGVMATISYGDSPEAVRELLARARTTTPATAGPPAAGPLTPTLAGRPRTGQPAFNGTGFDACTAPSQSAMDTWRADSPFGAVGIYIGGRARACAQPRLTATWIRRQSEAGWHLMPIWVGPQPWDSSSTGLSTDPSEADEEGVEAAEGAVEAARSLGLGAGTVLYNDLEHYTDRDTWDAPVVAYLTAWTRRLHELGYRAAAYVHAASGALALSAHYHQVPQDMPDVLWVARWNLSATVSDADMGLPAGGTQWSGHRRAHQFRGGHDATYGDVTINIDRSRLDVDPAALPPLRRGRDLIPFT